MTRPSMPEQFALDNAAQIFVNIVSPGETTLSRIALIMSETVDRKRLQLALNNIIPVRFPHFQVYLKKTFLSYVLERTEDIPEVEEDSRYTNRYVDFHNEKFLFRFRSDGSNIALEMSHIISDGYGTLVLLLSVTAEYLRLGGIDVKESPMIFLPEDPIDPKEWECGYADVFKTEGPRVKSDPPAYIPDGKPVPFEYYYTTRYIMNLKEVRDMARDRKVTLVVFLSGIYLWAIQELFLEDLKSGRVKPGKPLRFQIPLNLRKDYPTKSLKNFVYIYSPSYRIFSPDEAMDIEDLIRFIAEDIRHERHTQNVENQVRRNLRLTASPLYKYTPRFIKERFLALFYQLFARGLFSGVLTSLGEVRLPEGMAEQVRAVDILACNSPAPGRNSTMFSYNGVLEMNIGSTVDDLRLEEKIQGKFAAMRIKAEVIMKREPSDPA